MQVNTTCCFYISVSGLIKESVDRLLEKPTWLTEASQPNLAKQILEQGKTSPPQHPWLLRFLGPLRTIVLLLIHIWAM